MVAQPVAVLYARRDSYYRSLAVCDVFDIDRDARTYSGSMPVIAHPPCRAWGRLRHQARPRHDERALAVHAVQTVRRVGGVLEHPASSSLWPTLSLPLPGAGRDAFGGWSMSVDQAWWGHRASKGTWLYVVGCEPVSVPSWAPSFEPAPCIVGTSGRRRDGTRLQRGDVGYRPEITKREREATPPAFARWLVELASRCRPTLALAIGTRLDYARVACAPVRLDTLSRKS